MGKVYSILVELGVRNNSITEIVYKWSNNDLQNTTLKAVLKKCVFTALHVAL